MIPKKFMVMRPTRQNYRTAGIFLAAVLMAGCASSRNSSLAVTSKNETQQEAINALEQVAASYAGKELSEEELRKLNEDLQKDPETQSAVKAIADAMEGKNANIKYSPATGKRYSGELEVDPENGVKLLPLEP